MLGRSGDEWTGERISDLTTNKGYDGMAMKWVREQESLEFWGGVEMNGQGRESVTKGPIRVMMVWQ